MYRDLLDFMDKPEGLGPQSTCDLISKKSTPWHEVPTFMNDKKEKGGVWGTVGSPTLFLLLFIKK